MAVFIYLLLINIFSFKTSELEDKLIFVGLHFRHGARAPQSINNDYYDILKEKWTNPGELTGMGQRMHYILGLRNRIRYIEQQKFISEKFDPHEILIYSSSFNRTLISVSSHLQGFFPESAEKGEMLTEAQEKISFPPLNVNYDEINDAIEKLNKSALPNKMMLAPIRMINHNERKIILFDIEGCTEEREEVKKKNRESLELLKNLENDFNTKYGQKLNEFFGTNSERYDLLYMNSFCDAFISAYIDTRELTEFQKTGLNFTELLEYCYEYNKINFLYHWSGDKERVLPHLETSKLMAEFIYYMKKRVDADINGENIEEKYKDYSRPKMLILSGHDSTISSHEVFLMDALGFNDSFFRFPKFAAQIAFEVTRKNDGPKKNYSDYFVNYYFNDEYLFNVSVQDFINKVQPHIWTSEQINEFCGFDEDNDYYVINNSTSYKKKDKAKTAYKVLMSIFICLTAILLAICIILGIKLSKLKTL